METLAPAVVAVIVTCDPGPWFEETLAAFAAQDYPELSYLVLDAGSVEDPTARVAAGLPGAYVRLLGRNDGFGVSANEAIHMVEGASHLLFCHDDVAPDPDAVHLLMEEAFRSNAGVVAPKLVSWDDPARLLHVGMAVDKSGAVVDRVEPGELDAGQHDAVRDVFLAPGGCTLVRADLFAELGGFDPHIFVLGEDLDLCWRAQVAGARVVVAPAARVRHLEQLASGRRAVPAAVLSQIGARAARAPLSEPVALEPVALEPVALEPVALEPVGAGPPAGGPAPGPPGEAPARRRRSMTPRRHGRRRVAMVTLQSLQRRHELHAVMKSYSRFHLVRVLPQVFVLSSAEYVIALITRHRDRAFAVAHAWRWNLARRAAIREERRQVAAYRRLDDAEVRRLQLHGSARLTAYLRRALAEGLRAAHLGGAAEAARQLGEVPVAPTTAPPRAAVPVRGVAWLIAAVVVVFGSRSLIGNGLPYVGQFLAMPSVGTLLHRFASGWQPAGVGTTDPTSPATLLLGLGGIVSFEATGLLQKIVVLGCIPVGAWGMVRLLRPLGSPRARTAGGLAYLALPIAYDSVATGQWAALVAYAVAPWILLRFFRASTLEPYADDADPVTVGRRPGARRRHPLRRHALALGLLLAVVVAVAPSCTLLMPVLALALVVGIGVAGGTGRGRAAGRVVALAVGGALVAGVLLAPWLVVVALGPGTWQVLGGVAPAAAAAPGWSQLLHLALGPIGDSVLTVGFLVAAALPVWIGSHWRLAWAARAWLVVASTMAFAWAAGRGWLGPLAVPAGVMLAGAGAGLAMLIGLGVVSFEEDLRGHRFGWRQAGAAVAALAAVVGALPTLAASLDGRWELPPTGYGQATAWMTAPTVARQGDFRVLWLGDPRAVLGAGWQAVPGLAYTISVDGVPDTTGLWPPADPGAAGAVGAAVRAAVDGSTVRLGSLLAPYAVRYVVLVESIAPSIPDVQSPTTYPPPAGVVPGLLAQADLRHVISQGGYDVFVDDAALPLRAVVPGARGAHGSVPSGSLSDAAVVPVLRGDPDATAVRGPVPAGTLVAAVAPGSTWQVVGAAGRVVTARRALGYAAAFPLPRPGVVELRYEGSVPHALGAAAEVVVWLVVVAALLGRRRWLDWWWGPLRRRVGSPGAPSPGRGDAAAGPGAPAPGPGHSGATAPDAPVPDAHRVST